MVEVTITDGAMRDMEAIHDFISRDSTRYADRQIQAFHAAMERLSRFPGSGRSVPELFPHKVKEVIVGRYRMIYRMLGPSMLEIMVVHHGARRFPFGRVLPGT